ncbi:MAG: sulfotransferase family protein [Planctomycetes bacterium]|nr:sulfotransferase family protein [Planctomycetota bacterium]NOG54210.1 tetratricopeptide repeat protein [Planctomycetota bacterium]
MDHSGRHNQQLDTARQHVAQGDLEAAERVCRRVLRQRPRDRVGLCLLASILAQTRRGDEAVRTAARVIELYPADGAGYIEMARAYARAGRSDAAEQVFRQAEVNVTDGLGDVLVEWSMVLGLRGNHAGSLAMLQRAAAVDPGNARCWMALGSAALNAGSAGEAVEALEHAVALNPDDLESVCLLGHALRMEERLDEARRQFAQALAVDPMCQDAIGGLAEVLQSQREYEAAHALLRQATDGGSRHPGVVLAFARWCQWAKEYEQGVQIVGECLDQKQGVGPQQRLMLQFAAGALHEAQQEYEHAFRRYRAANDLYPRRFNRQEHVRSTDRLIESFGRDLMEKRWEQSGCDDACPVFVLGMPRSGTSLVEQVIASHPQAVGCGELTFLHEILSEIRAGLPEEQAYPACIGAMSAEALTSMGTSYVGRLRDVAGPDAVRATDKLPTNYWHVGLINLVLPKARIIHCRRHPMDTCFSIYATQLSPLYAYANDQRDLAVAYCEYDRLMEHWQDVTQIPILSIRYEDMVDDLETHARRIIEYVGLEWDDACLRFHEAKRVVGTASEDQVRRPIYRSSVERWRHFEEYLGRLREGLGGAVEAYEQRGLMGS